ncbi:enoyl-CoA hydratase [Nitratireductor mangrovi]|uniref:Enoyl-CoA hydratase n=1 Tax=Nitratireductor mangrovi TaxID=2599600 RepID=A0A5B8L0F7_9HYPH|nr:enoyl-CoA hydratase-related protein [Nitratireductor mangrovi]QDZ01329.1 enoyl-CoA hydratase [Nitratireductor mangrovi]
MARSHSNFETLDVTVEDHIARVAINRPDNLNAINMVLYEDIFQAFRSINDDTAVWVAILTGNGRAFSVGADLKERQTMTKADVQRRRRLAPLMFGAMSAARCPVIAAINGFAFGGGFELALACDVLVASENAEFSLPETRLGVIPAGGATQRLSRMIGVHKAKEIILTGRKMTAREIFDLGILNRLAPEGEAERVAREIADEMKQSAPMALTQAKKAVNGSMNIGLDVGLQFEAEAYQACLASKDRDEGLAAFREKRKPRYTGE